MLINDLITSSISNRGYRMLAVMLSPFLHTNLTECRASGITYLLLILISSFLNGKSSFNDQILKQFILCKCHENFIMKNIIRFPKYH